MVNRTKLVSVKNLLYGLSYAPENSERIYYYILIQPDRENAFREALAGTEPFNITEYGAIIATGWGDPPEGLKEELRIKYNAVL